MRGGGVKLIYFDHDRVPPTLPHKRTRHTKTTKPKMTTEVSDIGVDSDFSGVEELGIEDAIGEFGKESWDGEGLLAPEIVAAVRTFDDALHLGIAFLDGRLGCSLTYGAPFGESTDSNGHGIQRDNLIALHHCRLYTHGGQINMDSMAETPSQRVQQKSYLSFIAEETTMQFLLPHLLADERLWVKAVWEGSSIRVCNWPEEVVSMNVTRKTGADGVEQKGSNIQLGGVLESVFGDANVQASSNLLVDVYC